MTDVKMKTTMRVLFVAERQREDHEPDQPALLDRNQNSRQLSTVLAHVIKNGNLLLDIPITKIIRR